MSMQNARRQMPVPAGRMGVAAGESGCDLVSGEAVCPWHESKGTGSALLQVLQPILDPTFSEHSYGFRPGRRAHDAVLAAQKYVQSGRKVVVDVDLEKFFDRVNHDILLFVAKGEVKRKVAAKVLATFKHRVRQAYPAFGRARSGRGRGTTANLLVGLESLL